MRPVSPKYQLDLMESPLSVKSPVGMNQSEALQRFERALDLFHIGIAFEEEEDISKALAFYAEAIEANPNMSPAYLRRGKLNMELGNYNEALNDLFIYRNQQPQCPRVLLYLSRISMNLFLESNDEYHRNNARRYLDWSIQKNLHYSIFRINDN